MYTVEYYEEKNKIPVVEFLKSLQTKEAAKILREIDLLEKFGFSLGMPYIKKLAGTDDLWELRIKHSTNNYRVFYFHYANGKFILLHGIKKKTQKTSSKDIDISLDRMRKYIDKAGVENET